MTQASASSPKEIRKAQKASAIAEREAGEVITNLMSTTFGRKWVWEILTECHIFHNPFTSDALSTAFACGEMNIGQKLLAQIARHCPDSYILAMREANERSSPSPSAELAGSENADRGFEAASGDDDDYGGSS